MFPDILLRLMKCYLIILDEDFAMASMMTEKVLRLCALNSENSVKIADKVLQEIGETDKQYLNHICSALSENTVSLL